MRCAGWARSIAPPAVTGLNGISPWTPSSAAMSSSIGALHEAPRAALHLLPAGQRRRRPSRAPVVAIPAGIRLGAHDHHDRFALLRGASRPCADDARARRSQSGLHAGAADPADPAGRRSRDPGLVVALPGVE